MDYHSTHAYFARQEIHLVLSLAIKQLNKRVYCMNAVAIEQRADYATRFQPGNRAWFGAKSGRPIIWTKPKIKQVTEALKLWIDEPKNYYVISFCNEVGLLHSQLEDLASKDPEFAETYKIAKQVQEIRLVDLAVSRKGDGNFIKFVLANKAGWREKTELSGDSSNPLAIVLDKISKKQQEPIATEVLEPQAIDHTPQA